ALDAPLHGRDGYERRGPALEIPATANEIVHRDHAVALAGQVHRLRPAEIAVRAEHDHRSIAHARSSWECWDPATFGKKTFRRGYGLGLCLHDPPAGHNARAIARVKAPQ